MNDFFWFKPEYTQVQLIADINKPWNRNNGGAICPGPFLKRWPGSFLFSLGVQNEMALVLFYNPAIKEQEDMFYWVSTSVLEPLTQPEF